MSPVVDLGGARSPLRRVLVIAVASLVVFAAAAVSNSNVLPSRLVPSAAQAYCCEPTAYIPIVAGDPYWVGEAYGHGSGSDYYDMYLELRNHADDVLQFDGPWSGYSGDWDFYGSTVGCHGAIVHTDAFMWLETEQVYQEDPNGGENYDCEY